MSSAKGAFMTSRRWLPFVLFLGLLGLRIQGVIAEVVQPISPQRLTLPKPLLLYDFNEVVDGVIADQSRRLRDVDLLIDDLGAIEQVTGGIEIKVATTLVLREKGKEVVEAMKRTNELSVEIWFESASMDQAGPARMVSISSGTSRRNFTLGQDGRRLDFRLRTSQRDRNGLPSTSTSSGSLLNDLTHIVVTRSRDGHLIIYQNGYTNSEVEVPGDLRNWDEDFKLVIGNEFGGGRPWLGKIFRIAVYDRCISNDHVVALFNAGSEGTDRLTSEQIRVAEEKQHFRDNVAPLLANHCLECHDPAIRQGGLDLSSQFAWERGGENGKLFEKGDLDSSLIWQRVVNDEMPHDRPPLTEQEKKQLRQWLVAGAPWPFEKIDPANYRYRGQQGEVWLQRLTIPEYIATVRATFGVDIESSALKLLPRDVRADGFTNTAYNMSVDLEHIEAYRRLAELIVEELDLQKFARRFSKSQKLSTDDTMREQIAKMGRWVLRGELSEAEQNDYSGVATTVASVGGDFEMAIGCVLEAMLQSPRFLYRVEYQRGGGGRKPVSPQELANRMSYILWGAAPDQELIQVADNSDLLATETLEQQIDRMLSDERAISRSIQFVEDWLHLGRLINLRPDAERFPEWSQRLATQMRQETLDFFVEVVWHQDRPLADLLNAQISILHPELAKFYGLIPPADGNKVRYDLSKTPSRGGLLTQASLLTLGGDDASMVSRGLFVLDDLLRGVVNAPPPCVNTTPPATAVGLTQRSIAESRIADQTCGVCHSRFEPLAFGLERFNGIGAYLEVDEHGNRLREDGEVLIPGNSRSEKYDNVEQLMNLLAGSERVRESLTWKLVQFSLGRPLTADDAESVMQVHRNGQQSGGGYRSLMKSLIQSDLVLKTWTEDLR